MDDLQQAIAKLRSLSPRLNNAADQAQRVVLQIEQFLANECQVAVQAEVPVIYNDKGVAVTLLRYGRVDGKFRIALTNTDGDARFITRAWTECDRNEKLASFAGLPKLLMAVTKAVEGQIQATNTTTTTVNALMSALGSELPEENESSESVVSFSDQPKLALIMQSDQTLQTEAPKRSAPVIHARPATKSSDGDGDGRRSARKGDLKVG